MRPRENLFYVKRGFQKSKFEEGRWPFPSKQAVCAVSAGEEVRRIRRVYHATLTTTKSKTN